MQTLQTKTITAEHIANAISYPAYRQLIADLLEQNKTTGPNQTEALLGYTKMNVQRMKRWDKTFQVNDNLAQKIKNVSHEMIWLILTEGWCGDAAQNIPGIVKIAEHSPRIKVRFLLRDENPDVMDQYLTNGTRSIPKLIALDAVTLDELFIWGPRPVPAHRMVMEAKANNTPHQEYVEQVHKWYAQDKGQSLQQEFSVLIDSLH